MPLSYPSYRKQTCPGFLGFVLLVTGCISGCCLHPQLALPCCCYISSNHGSHLEVAKSTRHGSCDFCHHPVVIYSHIALLFGVIATLLLLSHGFCCCTVVILPMPMTIQTAQAVKKQHTLATSNHMVQSVDQGRASDASCGLQAASKCCTGQSQRAAEPARPLPHQHSQAVPVQRRQGDSSLSRLLPRQPC